jgi:hypothetical protein
MKRLRLALIAAGLAVLGLVLAQPVRATIATQQAQIGVTIVVNVSPSPEPSTVGLNPGRAPAASIAVGMSLHNAAPAIDRAFQAQSLHFEPASGLLVAQVQKPNLVQAEVSPNPNATLLTSNSGSVIINATAGSTVQVPCAFTVSIDSAKSWQIDEGITNDFGSSFPGKDLANNTYVSSPKPTSTPYVVFADDGSVWSLLGSGSTPTTYCVTLTVTVPGAVTAGTYSSNAIYTLFF